jgi:hypothetical protein
MAQLDVAIPEVASLDDDAATAPRRLPRWLVSALALTALYVVAVAVYVLLGRREHIPIIAPDEFSYKHVAQSIAQGNGFTWRGGSFPIRAALYVLFIAPAWLISSGASAYTLAKAAGPFAMCLTAVPVWLLVRPLVSRRWALAAAALSLSGTWMVSSAGILTENLALPLSTACLCSTVALLRTGRTRWLAVAIGFAALAAFARLEMVVLGPIILGAALVNMARLRGDWHARVTSARPALAVTGAALAALLVAYLVAPNTLLGSYNGVQAWHVGAWSLARKTAIHLAGLVALTGVVPALAVLAASLRRSNWARDDSGPLLVVIWTSAAGFAIVAGAAMVGFAAPWPIERYVEYPAPLLLAAFVVLLAQRRLRWPEVVIATAALSPLLLLTPTVGNLAEERGLHAAWGMAHAVVGGSAGQGLALLALVAGLLILAALLAPLRVRTRPGVTMLALLAVTAAFLIGGSRDAWHWHFIGVNVERATLPKDLEWVKDSGPGPVARLLAAANPISTFYTDFYNDDVTQVYAPNGVRGYPIYGRACAWTLAADGTAVFGHGCGTPPSRFLLDDPVTRLTFYRQRVLASAPDIGRVVAVDGRPRVMAALQVPCGYALRAIYIYGLGRKFANPLKPCHPWLIADLFLRRAQTLVLTFRGGPTVHYVALGDNSYRIAPRGLTTLRFPAGKGHARVYLSLDWTGYLNRPVLTGAALRSGGQSVSIL